MRDGGSGAGDGRIRATSQFVVLVCVGFLAGCLDVSEDITVNPDGSGKLGVDIVVPEGLLAMGSRPGGSGETLPQRLRNEFETRKKEIGKDPAVTRLELREFTEAGLHHFIYEVEVKDVLRLGDIVKGLAPEPQRLAGDRAPAKGPDLKVDKLDNGNIVVTLSLNVPVPSAAETNAPAKMAQALAQAALAGKYLTVKIHGPRIVSSTGNVDKELKTTEWKIGLADLASGSPSVPTLLRAEIQPRRGSAAILLIPILGIAVVLAIVLLRRKPKAAVR